MAASLENRVEQVSDIDLVSGCMLSWGIEKSGKQCAFKGQNVLMGLPLT